MLSSPSGRAESSRRGVQMPSPQTARVVVASDVVVSGVVVTGTAVVGAPVVVVAGVLVVVVGVGVVVEALLVVLAVVGAQSTAQFCAVSYASVQMSSPHW